MKHLMLRLPELDVEHNLGKAPPKCKEIKRKQMKILPSLEHVTIQEHFNKSQNITETA